MKRIVPKFRVRNTKTKTVSALGIGIPPGGKIADLFQSSPSLSESTVLDALRAPNGELHTKLYVTGELQLIECSLVSRSNPVVEADDLKTSNEPLPGHSLAVSEAGELFWRPDNHSGISVDSPLLQNGNEISMPAASAEHSGYLTSKDWQMFRGRAVGNRIWQYQDFSGPVERVLHISDFQNGRDTVSNIGQIIDGSAFLMKRDTERQATSGSLFSTRVEVLRHIGTRVELSARPKPSQHCRLWFLVTVSEEIRVEKIENHKEPPKLVRENRSRFTDHLDVQLGGQKLVLGAHEFQNEIKINDRLTVGSGIAADHISTSSFQLSADTGHHYALVGDMMGQGSWQPNPFVGAEPPHNPYDGQAWICLLDYRSYIYHGESEQWLGEIVRITGSLAKQSVANTYMAQDGISMMSNSEYLDGRWILTAIQATGEGPATWQAQVHISGVLVPEATLLVSNADSAHRSDLLIPVSDGKIQLFAAGSYVSLPKITATFRRSR